MASEPPCWRREQGNTLVLFPAALLVLLGLAAIALDSATVFLGQRRLADLAAAVANDAVAALDVDAFYSQDADQPVVPLDRSRAERRSRVHLSALGSDPSLSEARCDLVALSEGPPGRAVVRCEGVVRPILAPVLPGMPAQVTVTATEVALGLLH